MSMFQTPSHTKSDRSATSRLEGPNCRSPPSPPSFLPRRCWRSSLPHRHGRQNRRAQGTAVADLQGTAMSHDPGERRFVMTSVPNASSVRLISGTEGINVNCMLPAFFPSFTASLQMLWSSPFSPTLQIRKSRQLTCGFPFVQNASHERPVPPGADVLLLVCV